MPALKPPGLLKDVRPLFLFVLVTDHVARLGGGDLQHVPADRAGLALFLHRDDSFVQQNDRGRLGRVRGQSLRSQSMEPRRGVACPRRRCREKRRHAGDKGHNTEFSSSSKSRSFVRPPVDHRPTSPPGKNFGDRDICLPERKSLSWPTGGSVSARSVACRSESRRLRNSSRSSLAAARFPPGAEAATESRSRRASRRDTRNTPDEPGSRYRTDVACFPPATRAASDSAGLRSCPSWRSPP